MANPFFMNSIANNPMKDAYQSFMNSNNPMQLFMNMAEQRQDMQPIVQALRSGGNPQAIFNSLCQQRGINPQEFLKNFTQK